VRLQQRSDFYLGVGAIALAIAWLYVASGIEESMLSDATGAGGIPRVLGYLMAALGVLLCVRSVSFSAPAAGAASAVRETAPEKLAASSWPQNEHVQALILLGILAGYVVLAPYLGYLLATAVLLGVTAAYGGTPVNRNLVLVSLGGGIVLWLSFAWALNIPMQSSVLLDWF
jgi:putative tricarboxylic transport membrane protein